RSIYVDERIKDYIVALVVATRDPAKAGLDKLKNLIQFGASPRASIVLTEAARAVAFIQRRAYVTPDDVKSIARDALRHRLILTYEAEAEERTSDDLIDTLLAHVPVP
ncbi:MAG TPA: MoxR family ATPase, partial [Candidatus Aminicenantes bacterium]|nr:MoxR family ATPase [Candidatus Aminicenantes bacterium]